MAFQKDKWFRELWPGYPTWRFWFIPRDPPGCGIAFLVALCLILFTPPGRRAIAYLATGEKMKFEQATQDVLDLEAGVKAFRAECGRYPTTDEGLEALTSAPDDVKRWNGPYLKHAIANDPWGNPYLYTSPTSGKDSFLIESYGADGKPGGDGVAADIKDEGDGIRENKGY